MCPSLDTEIFHVYTGEVDVVLRGDGGNGHSTSVVDTILASYVYIAVC